MEVTYIVPTLNSAKTLDHTLQSLTCQSDVRMRVLVVDSGSVDGTLEICERWNIKALYCEPGNMYRAINIGLKESETEWIAYLNSDDWLYSDSVSRLVHFGNEQNSDIVYGNCDYTDFAGRFIYSFSPPKPKYLLSVVRGGNIGFAQQTAIFRRQLYCKLNGFDESYKLAADRDFFVRALLLGAKFSFLNGPPIACFRQHGTQLSYVRFEESAAEGKQISDSLSGKATLYDSMIRLRWKADNINNYAIRFLRQSLLAKQITFLQCGDSSLLSK